MSHSKKIIQVADPKDQRTLILRHQMKAIRRVELNIVTLSDMKVKKLNYNEGFRIS